MGIERQFVGWDRPALAAGVDWLKRHVAQPNGRGGADGGMWDLSGVTIALPGAEAGRRLLELLLQEAGEALVPPAVVTPGELPERLYASPTPVARPLQSMLARVAALRGADGETVATVVPHPPADDDWPGWWSLATQLEQLAESLAGGGLRVADVPEAFERQAVERTAQTDRRWAALVALEAAYHETLGRLGMVDRHAARFDAVVNRRCAFDGELVLLGVADLGITLGNMLDQLDGPVTALVVAPESHEAGFDQRGSLQVDYWQQQAVPLDDAMLRFVDRPTDQAREVVRLMGEQAQGTYSVDEVTVGLGDERLVGVVRRALDMAGLANRYAAGKAVAQSRPALYLGALGRFVSQHRFDDLAALLRHPDVERYLAAAQAGGMAGEASGEGEAASEAASEAAGEGKASGEHGEAGASSSEAVRGSRGADHWLTLLDRYAAEHLQGRVTGRWLGGRERQAQLKAVWEAVSALLPVRSDERRPLPAWSEAIAAALRAVYGSFNLQRHDRHHEAMIRSLEALAGALREQADLDEQSPLTPVLSASEAIALTLSRVSQQTLPEPGGQAAIELVGYLQLLFDDAPMLVVTSMNEGAVPSAQTGDAFLPNGVRSALGLPDNARRFARDLYVLHAVVRSRRRVTLLACRRSMAGEPLAPSRLLLNCDEAALVKRVRAFYDDDADAAKSSAPLLLSPGERDRFLIPYLPLDVPVIDRLRVTAFRDYLACPYRFYLRHVCRLEGVDDRVVELDAAAFGNLAHGVLEAFARGEMAACEKADDLAAYLSAELDEAVRRQYGREPRPAIRVQVEQLRERLTAFAAAQARLAGEGWRIMPRGTESSLSATIDVDGEPFTLTGRVDRIDHHPDFGYRIIDYKTGDTAKRPEQTHQRKVDGVPTWTDLQLPLYLDLAEPLGVSGPVELGYLNLPKKLADVRLCVAAWDEATLADARAARDEVIRKVRQQVYWPPSAPPAFEDEFAGVCADGALDRNAIIRESAVVRESSKDEALR